MTKEERKYKAWEKYDSIRATAEAEYWAIREPAHAKYNAICDPAYAKYKAEIKAIEKGD